MSSKTPNAVELGESVKDNDKADLKKTDQSGIGQNFDAASVTQESLSLKFQSIEKAKAALAENKRAEHEFTKAERIRAHKIMRDESIAAEEEAAEAALRAQESTDQFASRLMKKMKASVMSRIEKDVYIELRQDVMEDFDLNSRALIKQSLRDAVYRDLYEELTPVVEAELAEKLLVQVRKNLEKELRPIVEAQLKDQISSKETAPAIGSQSVATKDITGAVLSPPEPSLYPDLSHLANGSEQPTSTLEEATVQTPRKCSVAAADSPKRSLDDDEAAGQSPAKRSKTEKYASDAQSGNDLSENIQQNQSSETLAQFDAQAGDSSAWDSLFVQDNEKAHTKQGEDTTAVADAGHGNVETFTAVNGNDDGNAEGVTEAQEEPLFLPDYETEEKEASASEDEGSEEAEGEQQLESEDGEEEVSEDGNSSPEEDEEEVEPVSVESSSVASSEDQEILGAHRRSAEDEEAYGAHQRPSNPNTHQYEAKPQDLFNQPYGVKPKVNKETGEIEEDSEDDEEYDSDDDELPRTKIQKSMIAVTNTQDTAFVIDSSDEEDGEKTLVADTIEETTVLMKKEADSDGAFEEENVAEHEIEA